MLRPILQKPTWRIKMKVKAIQLTFIIVAIVSLSSFCLADGCFIPEAKKKIPSIPIQRALVKYQNGIETLIVQSTLNGEGQNFGWIMPVPAEPYKFEKISTGLLKTLSLQLQPKIHQVKPSMKVLGIKAIDIFVILMALTCIFSILGYSKATVGGIILMVFAFFAIPNFATYKSGHGSISIVDPYVDIKSRQIVGSYEIQILKAHDSSELNRWLEKNGLSAFPKHADKIVNDYIANNWFFAVAKLNSTEDGIATPHPILLEFKSDRAVYPMKLTALSESVLYIELFVVSESGVTSINYKLNKEYSDIFDYKMITSASKYSNLGFEKAFFPRKYFGWTKEVAHADALNVLWDGCIITKFSGQVSSKHMLDDMFFIPGTAEPFQSQMYSHAFKMDLAVLSAKLAFIIGLPLMSFCYYLKPSQNKLLKLKKVLVATFCFCLVVFIGVNNYIGETIDIDSLERNWYQDIQSDFSDVFMDPTFIYSTDTKLIQKLHEAGIKNPITKQPIIIEDSPGNISIKNDGNFQIGICLENGFIHYWLI